MDFVTFAADNYISWVKFWLESISRSNPSSRLFVYDVSTRPTNVLKNLVACYPNARYVAWPESRWQWPDWVDTTDFRFFWPGFDLRDQLKYLSRRLRVRLGSYKKHDWMIDKKVFVSNKRFFIRICCQKPYIIRDALARTDNPLVYVDADAIVLKSLQEFPVSNSDLAVTVVDQEQVRIGGEWEPDGPDGPLPVTLINAGVIFVNKTVASRDLLDLWITELSRVCHGASDQTALANLIYRHDKNFYMTGQPVQIPTVTGVAMVAGLPCAQYNQVRIPRDGSGIDSSVAIAHFVGSWKQDEHWSKVDDLVRKAWHSRGLAN